VIGAVTRRTVAVPVVAGAWQQPVEGGDEIGFGTRAQFHQGQSRGGVGYERVHQPVAMPGAESFQLGGNVDDPLPGRVDVNLDCVHRSISFAVAGRR
jgi:hypothetical protein